MPDGMHLPLGTLERQRDATGPPYILGMRRSGMSVEGVTLRVTNGLPKVCRLQRYICKDIVVQSATCEGAAIQPISTIQLVRGPLYLYVEGPHECTADNGIPKHADCVFVGVIMSECISVRPFIYIKSGLQIYTHLVCEFGYPFGGCLNGESLC